MELLRIHKFSDCRFPYFWLWCRILRITWRWQFLSNPLNFSFRFISVTFFFDLNFIFFFFFVSLKLVWRIRRYFCLFWKVQIVLYNRNGWSFKLYSKFVKIHKLWLTFSLIMIVVWKEKTFSKGVKQKKKNPKKWFHSNHSNHSSYSFL